MSDSSFGHVDAAPAPRPPVPRAVRVAVGLVGVHGAFLVLASVAIDHGVEALSDLIFGVAILAAAIALRRAQTRGWWAAVVLEALMTWSALRDLPRSPAVDLLVLAFCAAALWHLVQPDTRWYVAAGQRR